MSSHIEKSTPTTAPDLPVASFDMVIAADCPQDWRICVGLRGHLGYQLDTLSPDLRGVLLPAFHERPDLPAPFRLVWLPHETTQADRHLLRLITFGPHAVRLQQWLANLLARDSGILDFKPPVPFSIGAISNFQTSILTFPSIKLASSQHPGDIRLVSESPFFSKSESAGLFASGHWTQWLAIRFADLAGVRRQSLASMASLVKAEETRQSTPVQLTFGSRRRSRNGNWFTLKFAQVNSSQLAWINLLQILGLGQHTAYGAGNFAVPRQSVTNDPFLSTQTTCESPSGPHFCHPPEKPGNSGDYENFLHKSFNTNYIPSQAFDQGSRPPGC